CGGVQRARRAGGHRDDAGGDGAAPCIVDMFSRGTVQFSRPCDCYQRCRVRDVCRLGLVVHIVEGASGGYARQDDYGGVVVHTRSEVQPSVRTAEAPMAFSFIEFLRGALVAWVGVVAIAPLVTVL